MADISYTPERINQLVEEATKEVESAKNIFQSVYGKVSSLSLSELKDNKETYVAYLEKAKRAATAVENKHTKFFNIVDMYDYLNMPDNVRTLERLTDKLNDYYMDIDRVADALEEALGAVEKLSNFYNEPEY